METSMKRALLSVAVFTAVLFCFAACGGDEVGEQTDGDSEAGDGATDGDSEAGNDNSEAGDNENDSEPEPEQLGGICTFERIDPIFSNWCYEREFDSHGNLTHTVNDHQCDGTLELNDCWTYEYDSRGNMTSCEIDYLCDGEEAQSCGSWEYDENGLQISYSGKDCFKYIYDSAGRKIRTEEDYYCSDGLADRCYLYSYDTDGRLVKEEFRDAAPLTEEGGSNCYGTIVSVTEYGYDEKGRLVSERTGYFPGAEYELIGPCYQWGYNEFDKVEWEFVFQDCGNIPDECRTWTFDGEGRNISGGFDDDCDRVMDGPCYEVTYDEKGRMASVAASDFCDGVFPYCESWLYDDEGYLAKEIVAGGCGEETVRETHYEGFCRWDYLTDPPTYVYREEQEEGGCKDSDSECR